MEDHSEGIHHICLVTFPAAFFCMCCGLSAPKAMQAVCPEERAVAVETGAGRVAATLRWLRRRRFMTPVQLARFDPVVSALRHHPA